MAEAPDNSSTEVGEFFIPDLCAPRPVLVMILVAELLLLVYVLVASGLRDFDWSGFGGSSLFVQWVVLVSAGLLCWSRPLFRNLKLPLATAGAMAIVLSVTALFSLLLDWLYPLVVPAGELPWWVLRNMLVAGILAAMLFRYFYLRQQLLLRDRLALQARLDVLRTRIRPHFLFNTLNSIASLIGSRPAQAETAVEDLAELFRASLKDGDGETTVADELRLCQLYLEIESLRLGDRLALEWDIDDSVRGLSMPGLVLQPLVENAIYHGVARLPAGGRIRIAVQRQGDELVATVENPVPAGGEAHHGHRMALANVEQRLQAIYGSGAGLDVVPGDGEYRVSLRYAPGSER